MQTCGEVLHAGVLALHLTLLPPPEPLVFLLLYRVSAKGRLVLALKAFLSIGQISLWKDRALGAEHPLIPHMENERVNLGPFCLCF